MIVPVSFLIIGDMKCRIASVLLFSISLVACDFDPATTDPATTDPATTDPIIYTAHKCVPVSGLSQQSCFSPDLGLKYWLYQPPPEKQSASGKTPMVIYLHGFSHSGSDLNRVLEGGIPEEIEQGRTLPMVVISPQCPTGDNWQYTEMVERLSRFAEECSIEYGTDLQRVFLTGFSMGGDGVWALGTAFPRQFAAMVPVGSWYDKLDNVCRVRDVSIWVFQGEEDPLVVPQFAIDIVEVLEQCSGNVKLTMIPNAGHGESSVYAYGLDALYTWLLQR